MLPANQYGKKPGQPAFDYDESDLLLNDEINFPSGVGEHSSKHKGSSSYFPEEPAVFRKDSITTPANP